MALSNRQKRKIHETIKVVLILITAAVMMIPIIWICMAAFKTHVDVYQLKVFFKPTLENFATVFESPYDLHHKLWNSTIVALVTVLFAIPLATLAAYSFSRFRMRGERVMFVMILATQFVPAVVIVLPVDPSSTVVPALEATVGASLTTVRLMISVPALLVPPSPSSNRNRTVRAPTFGLTVSVF